MTGTPRTDAAFAYDPYCNGAKVCRQLECELNAMTAAKDKAVEALRLYVADCELEHLEFNEDTLAAALAALAELEEVKA